MTTATLSALSPRPSSSIVAVASGLSVTISAASPRPVAVISGAVCVTVSASPVAPRPRASFTIALAEIGDQKDFTTRLRSVIPSGWFRAISNPTTSLVLDGIVSGFSYCLSWAFSLVAYAKLQTRLSTSTDVFLDMFGLDYLDRSVTRRPGEADDVWRNRIYQELNAPKITREALIARLTNLTGLAPFVMDVSRTADTGAYRTIVGNPSLNCFYGGPGGYGSLNHPYEIFVTAYRPNGSAGIVPGSVSDAEIYAEAAHCAPAGTTVWMAISN